MDKLLTWLSANTYTLISVSIISLLIGVLMLPIFVTRIPQDYFSHNRRHIQSTTHPLVRLIFAGIKNLLGAVLVLAGILMLFLPGQGLITLLVGLMIMNYPGKYRLECWLVQRPHVLPAINWLREKYQHPPLLAPDHEDVMSSPEKNNKA